MKITSIYKFKRSGKWYITVTALDSGNGIENVEIPSASAKDLIKEFGLQLQDASGTWETYM